MQKPTKVQKLIYSMLTENTGSHLLDSGGAYGRNHERNAKKTIQDFINEPEESYEFNRGYVYRTLSVFHYLSGLELDDICVKFNQKNSKEDNWDADADVYGVGEKTWQWLTNNNDVKVEQTFNTYNGDSDLSQILQGSYLTINEDTYYLLQVHGGCDARGGYTDAKLFKTARFQEGIHEYLLEYKEQSQIIEDLEYGYISEITDYLDSNKKYTAEEILSTIKTETNHD
jgi:hypothetical protein